jgi:polysaccharide export outer membrane protein
MFRFSMALIALAGVVGLALPSAAQPQQNSLVPGIQPYTPARSPGSAATPSDAAPSEAAAPQAASSQNPATDAEASKPAVVAPMPARAAVPTSQPGKYEYLLGPGDKLRIIVFGEVAMSTDYVVAGNGTISFPLIGTVQASGKTVEQLQDEIAAALADGYIKQPKVSAEVEIFRPFYILGEVAKPGAYPYSDNISVMDAVATAGGFTYRANRKYVLLKRAEASSEVKALLTDELKLAPGDTVRVLERYF